jgi:hypothetical protein
MRGTRLRASADRPDDRLLAGSVVEEGEVLFPGNPYEHAQTPRDAAAVEAYLSAS